MSNIRDKKIKIHLNNLDIIKKTKANNFKEGKDVVTEKHGDLERGGNVLLFVPHYNTFENGLSMYCGFP